MELVEGDDLSVAHRAWTDPRRRSARHREADRRRPRGGARAGDHPSRSEAREHQGAIRRHREGTRLRIGKGDGPGARVELLGGRFGELSHHHLAGHDRDRHDPGHGRVHESRAGARQNRGQARRHLGVRCRAVRDAHGRSRVRRRGSRRDDRRGHSQGARVVTAAGRHANVGQNGGAAMLAERSETATSRHRRRASGAGRRVRDRRAADAHASHIVEAARTSDLDGRNRTARARHTDGVVHEAWARASAVDDGDCAVARDQLRRYGSPVRAVPGWRSCGVHRLGSGAKTIAMAPNPGFRSTRRAS